MRIFVASGIFHPEPGGPATYLYHVLPEFIAQGHAVTLLTYGERHEEKYPYPVTRISRQQGYWARQRAYRRASRRLWPGHDLGYLHTLGLSLADEIHPRIVKIVGDLAWERSMNRGWIPPDTDIDQFQVRRQSLPAEISKALRSSEARRMDHVIVPSKYLKRMVIGWGVQPERITVIYNAVQLTTLPDLSQAAAREALGLRDGPLLLTAARLTAWKGIDHTLHALSRVPDIQLIIAGDGPERSSLEALSERLGLITRVQFLGQVARDALPLFMKASDYCLLYSGYEGLSHTLLEALSVGTPVIASDKGGNPEIVSDGINGLLAPYINIEALADTLARAFETGLRSRLAAGTHAGMERFGWDSMIASTINTLLEFGGG